MFLVPCWIYNTITGMEIVSSKQRVSTNVILNLFYPAGDVLLGVIAMYVNDWRWFLRLLYGPGVIFFFYYWWVLLRTMFFDTSSLAWTLFMYLYLCLILQALAKQSFQQFLDDWRFCILKTWMNTYFILSLLFVRYLETWEALMIDYLLVK